MSTDSALAPGYRLFIAVRQATSLMPRRATGGGSCNSFDSATAAIIVLQSYLFRLFQLALHARLFLGQCARGFLSPRAFLLLAFVSRLPRCALVDQLAAVFAVPAVEF